MEDRTTHLPSDPSALTTALLAREIASLKELLLTRIEAIEKAITVAHQDMVRFPTEVEKQVGNLKELVETKLEAEHQLKEEKFRKVDQRFELIEKARIEQKRDTEAGVKNAFDAAKELVAQQNNSNTLAIEKSEKSMAEQIKNIGLVIQTEVKGFDDKFLAIKERQDRSEGQGEGAVVVKTESRESDKYKLAIIVALIALGGFVLTLLAFWKK